MRILLVNDDGIMAPGIEAMYVALRGAGEVEVVAPETTQSAVGHAISVKTPIYVHRVHVNNVFYGWSVDGRPADCVKLAMHELLEARPDVVVSGINAGANTAINVLYSGTVAGAVEGAFFGVPSIAFSLELSEELDFHRAGAIARRIFDAYMASKPPRGACLNVNIPALDAGPPRGLRVCPQATLTMEEYYYKQTDARGGTVYWLDGRFPNSEQEPDSDYHAMKSGFVTVTPLRFDMTDRAAMARTAEIPWPDTFA